MYYHDEVTGSRRMKRRYKYALIAFVAGFLSGTAVSMLL